MSNIWAKAGLGLATLLSPFSSAPVIGQALTVAPAVSHSRADRPTAELKIFSSKRVQSVWTGSGPSTMDSEICAASSTGRYRLQILSSAGLMIGPSKLRYTLRFRDATGLQQVSGSTGLLVTFEGSSPDQRNCDKGPNATLVVESTQEEMLAQQAGSFTDRLVLSVSPL